MSRTLYHYYERELTFIRQLAQEFAKQYPGAAGRPQQHQAHSTPAELALRDGAVGLCLLELPLRPDAVLGEVLLPRIGFLGLGEPTLRLDEVRLCLCQVRGVENQQRLAFLHPVTEVDCTGTGDPTDVDTLDDLRALEGRTE